MQVIETSRWLHEAVKDVLPGPELSGRLRAVGEPCFEVHGTYLVSTAIST